MGKLIKEVPSQFLIEFDSGKFDSWCVYLETPTKKRYPPLDTEYFSRLYDLGQKHGHQKIYDDYIKFYNPTSKIISTEINDLITDISKNYNTDSIEIDMWFSVIYGGMIAEENKQFAVLKKRIKRLGMYQVLIDGQTSTYAANFSKNKKWRELDSIMKQYGI